MDKDALKEQILKAFLKNGALKEITLEVLYEAASEVGGEKGLVDYLWPRGVEDAFLFFNKWTNRLLEEEFQSLSEKPVKTTDKIRTLVLLKLEILSPYKVFLQKALPDLKWPPKGALILKGLYNTIDTIWFLAGDKATDYNFYTKRLLLGYVYSATLLAWLKDESVEQNKGPEILEIKLKEVLKIPHLKQKYLEKIKVCFKRPFR